MAGQSRIAAMTFSSPSQFGLRYQSISNTRLGGLAQISRNGP
jgi:hypothetical protein